MSTADSGELPPLLEFLKVKHFARSKVASNTHFANVYLCLLLTQKLAVDVRQGRQPVSELPRKV
jgi:hypothetical protein